MGTDVDVVVVGAGIVGAATARAVLARLPGTELVVLEKEPAPARHQTGRNSGVVHSGCYYPPGSAKARLVREGRAELLDLVRDRGLPLLASGKVVVATRDRELARLAEIERRAAAGGIEVRRLTPTELRRVEPHVRGTAALSVPSAASVDYAAVTAALVDEVRAGGAEVRTGTALTSVTSRPDGLVLGTSAGEVRTRWLVNCAGLHSDRVARMCGAATDVRVVPFRGEYLGLRPGAAGLCRTMVYPVPDPRWPFLGVHLTRGVDGHVHAGPNAVLALGREAYRRGAVRADVAELVRDPGLWRLGLRYWRTGAAELVRSRSVALTARELRRMVPDLRVADLVAAPAGIRAQALRRDGRLVDDFEFAASPRALHVVNAPSPAATASLAIGREVAERLARAVAG